MELQNPGSILSLSTIIRRWLILVAIIPVLMVHRLAFWVDELLFPALQRQHLGRVLFIVGLPRSGTTLLHRLIAQQSKFTTFPLWELIFAPALCEKYIVYGAYRLDLMLGGLGNACLTWLFAKLGGDNAAHATALQEAEEDFLGLLAFDGCFLRVLAWPHSRVSWRLAFMDDPDALQVQQRLLKRYRGLLARHICFRGSNRTVVSKNPSFTAWIEGLAREFPEARFMALRRQPIQCVASQLSSIREGLELFGHRANDPRIVDRFVQLMAHYWQRIEAARESLEEDRLGVVEYERLTQDPFAVTLSRLEQLGYEVSEEDRETLAKLCERAKQYRSRHRYSLAEFGLTDEQIAAAFQDAGGYQDSVNDFRGTTSIPDSRRCAGTSC